MCLWTWRGATITILGSDENDAPSYALRCGTTGHALHSSSSLALKDNTQRHNTQRHNDTRLLPTETTRQHLRLVYGDDNGGDYRDEVPRDEQRARVFQSSKGVCIVEINHKGRLEPAWGDGMG